MAKRVIILGSTGSIGCNALSVAENQPEEFEIVALAAGSNWRKIAEQIERWGPAVAVMTSGEAAKELARELGRAGEYETSKSQKVKKSKRKELGRETREDGGEKGFSHEREDGCEKGFSHEREDGCEKGFSHEREDGGEKGFSHERTLADGLSHNTTQARSRCDNSPAGNSQPESQAGNLCHSSTQVWSGADALVRVIREVECDFVLSGIVGVVGLPATLEAVRRGLTVGLANKESLVVAGEVIVAAAKASGALLLPVDSEHSAIFQCLQSGRRDDVERILLTASGGPFRTWSREQMRAATLDDAMRHPTWEMGPKITIDSATMMNKALEIVEARWLFDVDPDRIEVVVHPESIIHSMVAFRDGSVMAQMGQPDMRTPIQYAMTYPRRLAGCGQRLDFSRLDQMRFEAPDPDRFPALRLGHHVARQGGTAGAAMNAANEAAVEAFRQGRVGFLDIVPMVEDVLRRHRFNAHPSLETLMEVDAWSRNEVSQCCTV